MAKARNQSWISGNDTIMHYVAKGLSVGIRHQVHEGVDVNSKYSWRNQLLTPLELALRLRSIKTISTLIELKSRIEDRYLALPENVLMLFHSCILANNEDGILLCLPHIQRGFDLREEVDIFLYLPIHTSGMLGWDIMRVLLIRCGLNPYIEVSDVGTPFHYACIKGQLFIVSKLTENGFDISWKTKEGCTPLACACECKNFDIAKFLILHGANPYVDTIKEDIKIMDYYYEMDYKVFFLLAQYYSENISSFQNWDKNAKTPLDPVKDHE